MVEMADAGHRGIAALLIFWLARKWKPSACAAGTVALALLSLALTVAEIPLFETGMRDNQTLKPLGVALRENYRPGDAVVCWGRFPQGLPFYSGAVISATNRPYFGGMDLTQVPFEFPGNRERLGSLLLPDDNALAQLLAGSRRVWVVSFGDTAEKVQQDRGARAAPARRARRALAIVLQSLTHFQLGLRPKNRLFNHRFPTPRKARWTPFFQ